MSKRRCFAFRADAGLEIGSGHVMRCLTLADALAASGAECHFLTRPHTGHLNALIEARGHKLAALGLPGDDYGSHPAPPRHAAWLGGDWRRDVRESRMALELIRPDWVILDHYGLDKVWEQFALPNNTPLMVIDDLADRPHHAEILLDQNLGRRPEDYAHLIPNSCRLLVGPEYALLRPEFAALRSKAIQRRERAVVRHLLITLGGVDKDNVTGAVLTALADARLSADMQITVVMGRTAPWLDAVRAQVGTLPCPARILVDVPNMAELMLEADVCVGAAGGTAWERCALGLPTLLIVLAENQRLATRALVEAGACLEFSSAGEDLLAARRTLEDPDVYSRLARRSAALTEGKGLKTVEDLLLALPLKLARATMADAEDVWRWRNEGDAWRHFKNAIPTALEAHLVWFEKALAQPGRTILIASVSDRAVGYIRFDWLTRKPVSKAPEVEISICLSGESRGKGLGSALIAAAVRKARCLGVARLWAVVHPENAGSRRAFDQNDFRFVDRQDGFLRLSLELA